MFGTCVMIGAFLGFVLPLVGMSVLGQLEGDGALGLVVLPFTAAIGAGAGAIVGAALNDRSRTR